MFILPVLLFLFEFPGVWFMFRLWMGDVCLWKGRYNVPATTQKAWSNLHQELFNSQNHLTTRSSSPPRANISFPFIQPVTLLSQTVTATHTHSPTHSLLCTSHCRPQCIMHDELTKAPQVQNPALRERSLRRLLAGTYRGPHIEAS